ncbi:unnamed protein product [Didymodactylos carnosus]|uniref:Uncharacterized protein n=2 Tax=Didymodactylos carnosus TaxID=1234261 RepID=A0A813NZJ1_9BILA|nr:unnamed protein product [Didymodactylos carnosus]CAF3523894.1 unnamed protein product [Didymodactylos carnosus]
MSIDVTSPERTRHSTLIPFGNQQSVEEHDPDILGLPCLLYYKTSRKFRAMVFDYVGPNLQVVFDHYKREENGFSLKTVCLIGIELITRSINAQIGRPLSYRDDLESLGYMLIYFTGLQLPWEVDDNIRHQRSTLGDSNDTSEQACRAMRIAKLKYKMMKNIDDLCSELPDNFKIYFQKIFKLSHNQRPNYMYLRQLFSDTITEELNEDVDWSYDWLSEYQKVSTGNKRTEMSSAVSTIVRTLLNPLRRTKRENLYITCYTNLHNNYDENSFVFKSSQHVDKSSQNQDSFKDVDWHQILLARLKHAAENTDKNSDYTEDRTILQNQYQRNFCNVLSGQNQTLKNMNRSEQFFSSSYSSMKKFKPALLCQTDTSKDECDTFDNSSADNGFPNHCMDLFNEKTATTAIKKEYRYAKNSLCRSKVDMTTLKRRVRKETNISTTTLSNVLPEVSSYEVDNHPPPYTNNNELEIE